MCLESPRQMLRRLFAALAGAAVGAGVYGVLGIEGTPSLLTPMGPTGLGLPKVAAPRTDSTPVRLLIPAIGVDAKVEARGLDADRSLGTPGDFRDVAWYN